MAAAAVESQQSRATQHSRVRRGERFREHCSRVLTAMHARARSLQRCRPTPWAPKRQTEFDAWQPRHSAVRVFERASALERARRPARRSKNGAVGTGCAAGQQDGLGGRPESVIGCGLHFIRSGIQSRARGTLGLRAIGTRPGKVTHPISHVRPQRDTNGSHTTYAGSPSIGAKPVGGGDRNTPSCEVTRSTR